MRRSIAALLAALAASSLTVACGTGETVSSRPTDARAADVPAPGELAAATLEALDRALSAHYALDATLTFDGVEEAGTARRQEVRVRVEGDADDERATAAVTFDVDGQRVPADVLYRPDELFVRVLGTWYGGSLEDLGAKGEDGRRELATPHRARRHFEAVFDGEVTEGPLVDGRETWEYAGRLDVTALRVLAERFGARLSRDERAQLEELGETTSLSFVVSKDDRLLRRLELDFELGGRALGSRGAGVASVAGTVVLRLSGFGKPVVVEPPTRYRPLEELAQGLVSGLG